MVEMGIINEITGAEEFITSSKSLEIGKIYTRKEIIHSYRIYGYTKGDPIPTDYCYNCTNDGIDFFDLQRRIFEKVGRGKFRYLGQYYPYSGQVTHTDRHGKTTFFGVWELGKFIPAANT